MRRSPARRCDTALMADADARRAWLFPFAGDVVDGVEIDALDPWDDGDRQLLLLIDHPELAPAIERGDKEIVYRGVTMSPTLHLAMHDVVTTRILNDEPREWWETAQRLQSLGYDRHETLHMLCNVVSNEVYASLRDEPRGEQQSLQELAALPDAWEGMRPDTGAPANRAERRALQRRRQGKRRP